MKKSVIAVIITVIITVVIVAGFIFIPWLFGHYLLGIDQVFLDWFYGLILMAISFVLLYVIGYVAFSIYDYIELKL